MLDNNKIWENFKSKIQTPEKLHPSDFWLLMPLIELQQGFASYQNLFQQVYSQEGQSDTEQFKSIAILIARNIARLEKFYKLPPCLGVARIDTTAGGQLNLFTFFVEINGMLADLGKSIEDNDLQEIQFTLNTVFENFIIFCGLTGVTLKPLLIDYNEIDSKIVTPARSAEFDYKTQYKAAEQENQSVIDIKLDRKKNYKNLTLDGKNLTSSGDLVKDFYKCVSELKKTSDCSLNYGPKFREYLHTNVTVYRMAYINQDRIEEINPKAVDESTKMVKNTNNALPVVLLRSIKTFEQFLDHLL